jgi:chromosomal replication initiation ATPase DnaA
MPCEVQEECQLQCGVTIWDEVLGLIRAGLPEEDFRRWFGAVAYASDAGDQITVWVPSEAVRRHIAAHYQDDLEHALVAVGRGGTHIRFVVAGMDEDEDE